VEFIVSSARDNIKWHATLTTVSLFYLLSLVACAFHFLNM